MFRGQIKAGSQVFTHLWIECSLLVGHGVFHDMCDQSCQGTGLLNCIASRFVSLLYLCHVAVG